MSQFYAIKYQEEGGSLKKKITDWDSVPIILDTQYVALIFGVSENTVKSWAKNGILEYKKIGKKLFFDKEHIKSVINKS